MEIDLTNIKSGFDPIPEGRYIVKCVDAKLGTSQAGNSKIDITLEIQDNEDFKNRKVWHTFTLTHNAKFALKAFLDACDSNLANDKFDVETLLVELIESTCSAYITPGKTPTGKDRSTLSNFTKLTDDSESMFS